MDGAGLLRGDGDVRSAQIQHHDLVAEAIHFGEGTARESEPDEPQMTIADQNYQAWLLERNQALTPPTTPPQPLPSPSTHRPSSVMTCIASGLSPFTSTEPAGQARLSFPTPIATSISASQLLGYSAQGAPA
jgi:hypothetical protein